MANIEMELFNHLRAIIRALEREKTPYALCGGLAMAVHGLPRATIDIDILIEEPSLEKVKAIGRENGFTIDAGLMAFKKGEMKIYRLTKIDPDGDDALMLDMILVTPLLEKVWESRFEVQWEDGPLWVVSREGLVEMKRHRVSGRDIDDIAFLEGKDDGR